MIYLPPLIDNILGHNYKGPKKYNDILKNSFIHSRYYKEVVKVCRDDYNKNVLPKFRKKVNTRIDQVFPLKSNDNKVVKQNECYKANWTKLSDDNIFKM